jgi:putative DNA primase/helicase
MMAESIAKALGGRKVGRRWMARCPAHDDRAPSLSILEGRAGKVLVCCHAGCEQAQVIAALRSRGVWESKGNRYGQFIRRQSRQPASGAKRVKAALTIWNTAGPAHATLVETYLASRGLHLAPPSTLRFHPGLKHLSDVFWPAMVALVTSGADEEPLGIHRTFISRDGSGKAPVEPQKMMLGPCRGGVVRLAPIGNVLMIGEGIETCLAAMQATGHPAWAALSTSGMRALDLPDEAREVIVLADGDAPGEAAARDAALRWSHEGRRVRIARPPQGLDFNDVLLGRISAPMEGDPHVGA